MATRLSDLPIVEDVATAAIVLRTTNTNAFVNSGVMVRDAQLDNFLTGSLGGMTFSPRFLGPLPLDEPNISNDDPDQHSVPKKITGGKNRAVRQSLNQSWSSMNFNVPLMGMDPVGAIMNQIGDYWNGILTLRLLGSLKGIVAMDLAGDKALTVDVSGESGAAALFNPDAFIDTQGTMGDRASSLTAVAVHSVVYNTMLKQDLIEFVKNSEGVLNLPTYMGKRLIVDDAMTYVAGSDGGAGKYYTYLFGAGAVALGIGNPPDSFARETKESSGNGAGETVLHSRLEWIIHPQGFSYGKDTTPTMAELEDAANWTMNYERKRIPLAALVSQG